MEAACSDLFQAVCRRDREPAGVAAPAHLVEHRVGVLQGHGAVARGGALEAGDLAAHAHPLEGAFERALHREGDFRNGELRDVAGPTSGMGTAARGAFWIKIGHGCWRLCYKSAAGQATLERRAR